MATNTSVVLFFALVLCVANVAHCQDTTKDTTGDSTNSKHSETVASKSASKETANDDAIAFHDAGIEFDKDSKDSLEKQTLAELEQGASNESPRSSGGGSGLAWDKHDFDVTNNKGGDVKVEVNLAAPMSTQGGGGSDDNEEDISDMLRLLQPQDEINPIELMSMMKDLMVSLKPEEPAQINITHVLESFKASLPPPPPPAQQDINVTGLIDTLVHAMKPAPIQYPPAPPPVDPVTIAAALQPPPPAPAPPAFDVSHFMNELRETLVANKPPPTPPPGVDPQLVELLKQTMADLRDLKKETHAPPPPAPMPYPPAQTPAPPQPTPPPAGPQAIYMPPSPPKVQHVPTHEDMKKMIGDAMAQIKPPAIPPMPATNDESQLENLRSLIRQTQMQAQRPIILPAPVALPKTSVPDTVVAPPPPPSPSMSTFDMQEKMKKMMADMMPKPQRIPAPPTVHVKQDHSKQVACCPAPMPGDERPETERCPLVQGVARPRCKRQRPPMVQPVKCTRAPCSRTQDSDGDVDVDGPIDEADPNWPGQIPATMNAADFNPHHLLKVLCPGGLCPGQKDLEPKLNPRPKGMTAQSGSI